MTAIYIPTHLRPLTQAARYCRNGKIVDATFQTELVTIANQAGALRGKEVFRSSGSIASMGVGASPSIGTRNRWRFQFHTGPFTQYVSARVVMAKVPSNLKTTADSYVGLNLTNLAGVLQGSDTFHWAQFATTTAPGCDVPSNFAVAQLRIAVTPNTDYAGLVIDANLGRALSAVVFEEILPPETGNGFIAPISAATGGPIYASDRNAVAALAKSMWLEGGAQTFNWSTDLDTGARVAVAVAADKNVIDNTSTVVSAATPGPTLGMANKADLAAAGLINCVIAAYGLTTGTSGSSGVRIKDSAGAIVTSLTAFHAVAGWLTQAFTLPVGTAKFDVQYFSNNGTFTLYAVSAYELG